MKEATTFICLIIYLFCVAIVSFGKVSEEQKQEVEKLGVKIYSWDEFLEVVGYYYYFSSYLLQICHEKAPSRYTSCIASFVSNTQSRNDKRRLCFTIVLSIFCGWIAHSSFLMYVTGS